MKCLFYSATFDNNEDLIEHYVYSHKINIWTIDFYKNSFNQVKIVQYFLNIGGAMIFELRVITRKRMIF